MELINNLFNCNTTSCTTLALGLSLGGVFGFYLASYQNKIANKKAEKSRECNEAEIYKTRGYLVKTHHQNTKISKYLKKFGMFENDIGLDKITTRTMTLPDSMMLADPVCTQFMSIINYLVKAQTHVEVGVFTGYNLFQQAMQLKENAQSLATTDPKDAGDAHSKNLNYMVYALDNTIGYFFLTRHHFAEAGIVNKNVDFRVQPGMISLNEMVKDETICGKIDSIFIDANKDQYKDYYDKCVQLLKPGGVLFVDNVLWSGEVCNYANLVETFGSDSAEATKFCSNFKGSSARYLHELNVYVKGDDRVKSTILPFGDGLLFAVKK